MGIHHTYKSQRGERSLKKQQKQARLDRRARERKIKKQQQQDNDTYVAAPDEIITLDLLTNPHKK